MARVPIGSAIRPFSLLSFPHNYLNDLSPDFSFVASGLPYSSASQDATATNAVCERQSEQHGEKHMKTIWQLEITKQVSQFVLSLSLLLIIAGSARAQQVTVDYDKGTDFSKYKTFAWAKGTPADNPMVHQRIVSGIEGQLVMKGLRKVESNPDIVVIYHAATDTQVSVSTMGGGPWGGWRWGTGTAYVDKVPVGQLVVDIGDRNSKKFVWRGTASGTINSKQEKNEKAFNKALTKMFENFPQPPGKKK
jgi:hypothetical protein